MNEIQEIHAKNKREIEESNMADELASITLKAKAKHRSTIGLRNDSEIKAFSTMLRRPTMSPWTKSADRRASMIRD